MGSFVVTALAGLVLVATLLSERLDRGPVTGPLLAIGFGVIIGPAVLGIVSPDEIHREATRSLLELTLIVVLATAGAEVDLRRLRRDLHWVLRLVLVAAPGMLVLGTLAAKLLLPSLSTFEAMILAGIVTPTDDEIRRPAISGERFPAVLHDALIVEGGLTDGIVVAFLVAALSLAGAKPVGVGSLWFAAQHLGLAVLIGAAIGAAGAALFRAASRRVLVARGWRHLAAPALALIAYGVAVHSGASGFTAAFCVGATLANLAPGARAEMLEGRALVIMSFALFGAIAVVPALRAASPALVLYALASLTLVRGIPVALALVRSGIRREPAAFAAWFGTRGIASILFALLFVERTELPGVPLIVQGTTLTVLASAVLHGVTAGPWNRRMQGLAQRDPASTRLPGVPAAAQRSS
jgi:NhaP-type Na+/H+ or K+/H+ antiporter